MEATTDNAAPQRLNELAAALAKAQAKMTNPKKTRSVKVNIKGGGSYTYRYAELAEVIDNARESLTANGLSVVQLTVCGDGRNTLVTRLLHSSGQYLESTYPLPVGAAAQEMGSAITYARRYSLCAILGIAADDDDDGAAGNDAGRGQSGEGDRDKLVELMSESSLGHKSVMDYCRANSLGDGRTVEDLSAETVCKLVDNWPAVSAAIKAAPKSLPANTTPVSSTASDDTKTADELPGLPDLSGMDKRVADLMAKDQVSKAQLKAYYTGKLVNGMKAHLPESVTPEKLPEAYIKLLVQPDNWAKALAAIKAASKN